jgi:hypothetical protein
MRFLRQLTVFGFAALLVLAGASANAQINKEKSIFTVTEPIDVGGTVLQPGTYFIKVVELKDHRSIIKITNENQSQVFATALATPHPITEQEITPVSRFVYFPSVPGQPKALRTWIAADAITGQDIVYPKGRALELASSALASVMSISEGTKETEYESTITTAVEPAPRPEVKAEAPYVAPPAPEPAPMVAEARPPAQLPKTGSTTPLKALVGLLTVAVAAAIRIFSR